MCAELSEHGVTISASVHQEWIAKQSTKRELRDVELVQIRTAQHNDQKTGNFRGHAGLAETTRPDGTLGAEVEIISWLDDCTRYALHVSAHPRITGPIVTATFRATLAAHGIPASTLTDNGMVYTVRLTGGRGGRNTFENELRRLHVVQKNSRPNHPTTCGKGERFQQT